VATGCLKPLAPAPGQELLSNITPPAIEALLATDPSKVTRVPPDERRQFVDKRQFKEIFTNGQADRHGFAFVDQKEIDASNGAASYYDWSPKPGLRFISLDTVSEGATPPMYRTATSTTRSSSGSRRRFSKRRRAGSSSSPSATTRSAA
jgi:hypothetical protein